MIKGSEASSHSKGEIGIAAKKISSKRSGLENKGQTK